MTQQEIKATWQEAGTRFYAPESDDFENMYRQKKSTALDKLAERYKRFSRMGFLCAVMGIFYLLPNHVIRTEYQIPWATFFIVYMLACATMDLWLYRGIRSIDCFTMTVKEVVEKAIFYRRRHLLFIAILLPIAIAFVVATMFVFGFEKYFLIGIFCGGGLGLIIGYTQYRRFMQEYKEVIE